MDKKTKNIFLISMLVLVLGIVIVVVFFANESPLVPMRACTMDARICADGTAVGRIGPACNFAQCPPFAEGVTVITSGTVSAYKGTAMQTRTAFNERDFESLKEAMGVDSSLVVYPELDFTHEFAFAIALGNKPSGGYEVKIKDVTETATTMTITYQEIIPGSSCYSIEMLTQPYIILRKDTPASVAAKKRITFISESIVQNCND
jgi:hypothetical protein